MQLHTGIASEHSNDILEVLTTYSNICGLGLFPLGKSQFHSGLTPIELGEEKDKFLGAIKKLYSNNKNWNCLYFIIAHQP